jgi:hypothetical protein
MLELIHILVVLIIAGVIAFCIYLFHRHRYSVDLRWHRQHNDETA